MEEVVWFYGGSAAGKETFIRKIINEKPDSLLKQFGWQGKKVVASQTSLNVIGPIENNRVTERRKKIEEETVKLTLVNDVVLIKGQYVDYMAGRQTKLKDLLPDCKHRIIVIKVPTSDRAERLVKKSWWKESDNPIKWAKGEQRIVEDMLKDLSRTFPVINIDGSNKSRYEIIKP